MPNNPPEEKGGQGPAALSIATAIIAKAAGVEPEEVVPTTRLVADLGIDSLTVIELIVRLEQDTGIRCTEEDARGFNTVGDILAFVGSKV